MRSVVVESALLLSDFDDALLPPEVEDDAEAEDAAAAEEEDAEDVEVELEPVDAEVVVPSNARPLFCAMALLLTTTPVGTAVFSVTVENRHFSAPSPWIAYKLPSRLPTYTTVTPPSAILTTGDDEISAPVSNFHVNFPVVVSTA
jgi:hypothetical protein